MAVETLGGATLHGMSPVYGCDVRAALAHFGGGEAAELVGAWLPDGESVETYEELVDMCPPERIGLTAGLHAAILAPLFGEFE